MSIHEVDYDTEGRIIGASCVDDKIKLAQEKPKEVLAVIGVDSAWVVNQGLPKLEENIRLPGASGVSGIFPFKNHSFTALTPDSVEEIEHVIEISEIEGRRTVVATKHGQPRTYYKKQINEAGIRVGRKGFVWTEPGQQVDIYVAPPKVTLASRVKTRIRI